MFSNFLLVLEHSPRALGDPISKALEAPRSSCPLKLPTTHYLLSFCVKLPPVTNSLLSGLLYMSFCLELSLYSLPASGFLFFTKSYLSFRSGAGKVLPIT